MRAIVLAGGSGTRLWPHTAAVPKPLVRIGGGPPVLEILLGQLARAGFTRVTIAVHHQAEQVARLRDLGPTLGIQIDCSVEERPLGTAGPLTLLDDLPDNFLVVCADILTDLDLVALVAAHRAAENDLTLATCRRGRRAEYGVVRFDAGHRLLALVEKPLVEHDVNMGIYAMSRSLVGRMSRGEPCGFDRLIGEALAHGDRVGVFPFAGYWRDIGSPAERDGAEADWPALRARLLGE